MSKKCQLQALLSVAAWGNLEMQRILGMAVSGELTFSRLANDRIRIEFKQISLCFIRFVEAYCNIQPLLAIFTALSKKDRNQCKDFHVLLFTQ